jgi:hypothetical protein
MEGNDVKRACARVAVIVALSLICSLSASAKGSIENSEVIDSGKAASQAADHKRTSKRFKLHAVRQHTQDVVPGSADTLPGNKKGALSRSQPIAFTMWQPLPGTSVSTSSSGVTTVSYRGTFWGGAVAYPEVPCDYRFDADGRLEEGGSGYGLAVRASVTDGKTPHGQGIQYDQGVGGFRDVLLPDRSESGTVKPAPIDTEWHHISVAVAGGRFESSVDGKVVFSGSTPTTCGNGILIRAWRSTADFRNMTVTPITYLSAP